MCLAIPGKVIRIAGADATSRVGDIDFGGVVKTVSLAFVPEAKLGDYVLVHVGFAISRIAESEAAAVFDYLREMGELAEPLERGP